MSRIAAVALSASVALLALAAPVKAAPHMWGRPGVGIFLHEAWYGEEIYEGESASLDVISVDLMETQPASLSTFAVGQATAEAGLGRFDAIRDNDLWVGQVGYYSLGASGLGSASVMMNWAGEATLTNISTKTVTALGHATYAIDGGIEGFGPDDAGRAIWRIGIENLYQNPGEHSPQFEESVDMVFGGSCDNVFSLGCGFEGPYDFNLEQLYLTLAPGESVSYDFMMDFDLWLSKSVTMGETPVPEPATLALLGLGLAGAAGFSRRRPA